VKIEYINKISTDILRIQFVLDQSVSAEALMPVDRAKAMLDDADLL